MIKKILATLFILALPAGLLAGEDNDNAFGSVHETSIEGQIIDKNTHEKLVCATIKVEGTDISITTDLEGKFEIKGLDPGIYQFKISYISYKEQRVEDIEIRRGENQSLIVSLTQHD
jgi:hypothetical protein